VEIRAYGPRRTRAPASGCGPSAGAHRPRAAVPVSRETRGSTAPGREQSPPSAQRAHIPHSHAAPCLHRWSTDHLHWAARCPAKPSPPPPPPRKTRTSPPSTSAPFDLGASGQRAATQRLAFARKPVVPHESRFQPRKGVHRRARPPPSADNRDDLRTPTRYPLRLQRNLPRPRLPPAQLTQNGREAVLTSSSARRPRLARLNGAAGPARHAGTPLGDTAPAPGHGQSAEAAVLSGCGTPSPRAASHARPCQRRHRSVTKPVARSSASGAGARHEAAPAHGLPGYHQGMHWSSRTWVGINSGLARRRDGYVFAPPGRPD